MDSVDVWAGRNISQLGLCGQLAEENPAFVAILFQTFMKNDLGDAFSLADISLGSGRRLFAEGLISVTSIGIIFSELRACRRDHNRKSINIRAG